MIFWLTCKKVQFYSIWQTVLDRWSKMKKNAFGHVKCPCLCDTSAQGLGITDRAYGKPIPSKAVAGPHVGHPERYPEVSKSVLDGHV